MDWNDFDLVNHPDDDNGPEMPGISVISDVEGGTDPQLTSYVENWVTGRDDERGLFMGSTRKVVQVDVNRLIDPATETPRQTLTLEQWLAEPIPQPEPYAPPLTRVIRRLDQPVDVDLIDWLMLPRTERPALIDWYRAAMTPTVTAFRIPWTPDLGDWLDEVRQVD